MSLIIYPNQLFHKKYIPTVINEIILYEHPHFFTEYKFNKLKLIYHRATMKMYEQELSPYFNKITYIEFHEHIVKKPMYSFYQPNKLKIISTFVLPTPNFLTLELFSTYHSITTHFRFHHFYTWMKKELNIIPTVSSQDKHNRNPIKNMDILPNKIKSYHNNKYVIEAISYVYKHFKQNIGPYNINEFIFPITRKQVNYSLQMFIIYKLKYFGKFQDALLFHSHSIELFHSVLSAPLNIGLINPHDIIQSILKVSKRYPVLSVEAFIRQLLWREYQLYCYSFINLPIKPYFNVNIYSLSRKWYNGTIGIEPVDMTIKKAFSYGYLHHIERLMIMGNFMLLCGVHPKSAHKWFMEFSVDSYEWVMFQNVYDMIFYVFGNTMRRIYISSSNYILKMSNLKKDEWCIIWDNLFQNFLQNHKGKIGFPYE